MVFCNLYLHSDLSAHGTCIIVSFTNPLVISEAGNLSSSDMNIFLPLISVGHQLCEVCAAAGVH